MAVDDNVIGEKIRSLRGLSAEFLEHVGKINTVVRSLESIQPGPDGAPPHDPAIGGPMSDARREEIYDICTERARDLIEHWPSNPDHPGFNDDDDAEDDNDDDG